MRVLIVEDRPDQIEFLEEACSRAAVASPLVEVAGDAASAIKLLESGHFDLAICDLAIPLDRSSSTPDREHGLGVVREVLRDHAGLPIIVFSEYGDNPKLLQHFVGETTQGDPYGSGAMLPMLRPLAREELHECREAIKEAIARTEEVAGIVVTGSGAGSLEVREVRAIQVFTRLTSGVRAEVAGLDGGLSGVRTMRVRTTSQDGQDTARVAAKIGPRERVLREARAFLQVGWLLPQGLFAPLHQTVTDGASGVGVAIYTYLEAHDRDLFECLEHSPDEAATVVDRLRDGTRVLRENGTNKELTLKKLRRELAGTVDLAGAESLRSVIEQLDPLPFQARECRQHGDLHGKNVLIDANGSPTLIDYGDVRLTSSCLDPLTLELSTVFHPAAEGVRGSWPREGQLSEWFDLDAFVTDCPFEAYVRRCRAWLSDSARSPAEVSAVVSAYVLRQLPYKDTDPNVALALLRAACDVRDGEITDEQV